MMYSENDLGISSLIFSFPSFPDRSEACVVLVSGVVSLSGLFFDSPDK